MANFMVVQDTLIVKVPGRTYDECSHILGYAKDRVQLHIRWYKRLTFKPFSFFCTRNDSSNAALLKRLS